jgi:transcriptional regulator GlxA family with amidase domain
MTTHWRLYRLVRHVERQVGQPLSLTKAAQVCGLEKTYFCRFFHAQTGMTFSEWHRRLRIERAKSLLREKRRSVAEVASAVGYHSIKTFQRHFRRCEQMSPAQYKRLRRGSETQQLSKNPQQLSRP